MIPRQPSWQGIIGYLNLATKEETSPSLLVRAKHDIEMEILSQGPEVMAQAVEFFKTQGEEKHWKAFF